MHTEPGLHSIPARAPITITSLYRHNGTLATRFSAQKQRIPQINCLPGCGYACIIEEHRGIHGLRGTIIHGQLYIRDWSSDNLPGAQDAIINNAFWQFFSYSPSF